MCLNPLTVRIEEYVNPSTRIGKTIRCVRVPCGHCPECRTKRRLQWVFRMEQESLVHEYNYFITLTYADKWLPKDGQIYKPDFQDFIKRLRTKLYREQKSKGICKNWSEFKSPKYYACGEYGDTYGRCHFHCILFSDYPVSDSLIRDSWRYGFIKYDPFTSNRAAYVVKYSQKHLFYELPEDVVAPCSLCSLALGLCYLTPARLRYYRATKQTDVFLLNGTRVTMPRYYYERIFSPTIRRQISRQKEHDRMVDELQQERKFGLLAFRGVRDRSITKWMNSYKNYNSTIIQSFHYAEI